MSTLNTELIQHIKLIADEKKIPRDTVADSLKDAIMKAYIKEFPDTEIEVIIDIDQQMLIVNRLLKVVEPYSDLNDYTEISLSDAKKHDKNVVLGDTLRLNEDLAKLERPMVSHILQVFKHNISNQSNKEIFKE
jgi:N utilization substance protein A